MLIDRPEGFIPDFVINDDKFTKSGPGPILDHDLPPTRGFGGWTRSKWLPVLRPNWFHNERAGKTHHRKLPVIATIGMELASTFLRVGMNVPFHFNGLAFGRHRSRVGRERRLPRIGHHHIRAANVEADFFAKF